jgi:hypothetical protein
MSEELKEQLSELDIEERRRLRPLSFWLPIVGAAGIAHVPVLSWSPEFPAEQIAMALEDEDPLELRAVMEWCKSQRTEALQRRERFMFRWDCCVPEEMMFAAANGLAYGTPNVFGDGNVYHDVTAQEYRFVSQNLADVSRLAQRPWLEPLRVPGGTAELRVFCDPAGVVAISNRHHKAAMPDTAFFQDAMAAARAIAEKIRRSESFPTGFTADFIIDSHGQVVWLDGGPPYNRESRRSVVHPCCFLPGQTLGYAFRPVRRGPR